MPATTIPEAAPPAVEDAVLLDLRRRLRDYRPVPLIPGPGWDRGVESGYLAGLVDEWESSYDWRVHELRIRSRPWVLTGAGSTPVRAIHQRSATAHAVAVLLLHGWPDSVLRFAKVLPLLSEYHVVVPALPGYPFAAPIAAGGLSAAEMAETVAVAMADLGYERYVVSAGDVGCDVAEALAGRYPGRVAALHLTDVSQNHFLRDPPEQPSETEKAYLAHGHDWQDREGGYMHEQRTKPHTLSVALGDSPAGLLAWLVEKLRSWSDCGGDVETVFTRSEILTWVTAYWVSAAIGTSFGPYAAGSPAARVTAPTVFTVFPHDLVNAPEEFARRIFDVRSWRDEPAGGHFAAWEQPIAYAAGIDEAVRVARG